MTILHTYQITKTLDKTEECVQEKFLKESLLALDLRTRVLRWSLLDQLLKSDSDPLKKVINTKAKKISTFHSRTNRPTETIRNRQEPIDDRAL